MCNNYHSIWYNMRISNCLKVIASLLSGALIFSTCKVVTDIDSISAMSITLNKTALTLTEGDSDTLTATVKPDNATDKSVT